MAFNDVNEANEIKTIEMKTYVTDSREAIKASDKDKSDKRQKQW